MPAPRQRSQGTLSSSLAAHANRKAPNNVLPLNLYYRSGHLLLRQADEYRAAGNQEQLFVVLMRLCSLILETVPYHKDYREASPEQKKFKQLLLLQYVPELEQLKLSLDIKGNATEHFFDRPAHARHTDDAIQLATSNLPQLDWDQLSTPSAPQMPAAVPSAPQAGQQNDPFAFAAPPPPPPSDDPFTASPGLSNAYSGSASAFQNGNALDLLSGTVASSLSLASAPHQQAAPSQHARSNSLKLPAASQAALSKHTIMSQPQARQRPANRPSQQSMYPQFDKEPLAPIDYGMPGAADPSAPALPNGLASSQLQQPNLMDAPSSQMPSPQLELQLGPQQVEVTQTPMPSGDQPPDPNGHCQPVQLPAPPTQNVVKKEQKIREVHVSAGLMEEFLRYATRNTRSGIESCGILAGTLKEKEGLFVISTLIIPKQEGTSDTVQALSEEEIFDVQDKRALYPLGWIHTHPTQTCFLSSVDVHTQCGYQTMLDEAIAIVMAPRDSRKKCGIFRLSTPGGLKLVQKCPERGFHAHPSTPTGQSLYELCGHVYLNPRVQHDVVDLR